MHSFDKDFTKQMVGKLTRWGSKPFVFKYFKVIVLNKVSFYKIFINFNFIHGHMDSKTRKNRNAGDHTKYYILTCLVCRPPPVCGSGVPLCGSGPSNELWG